MTNFIYPYVIHNTEINMGDRRIGPISKERHKQILEGLLKGTKIPNVPDNSKEQREVCLWLGGLISTDGCMTLRWSEDGYVLDITMASVEKDWIDMVINKMDEIGIKAHVVKSRQKQREGYNFSEFSYTIRFETRKTAFYLNYYARDWIMKRKLNVLDRYLERPLISKIHQKFKEAVNSTQTESFKGKEEVLRM